jgi:hypothetical protein
MNFEVYELKFIVPGSDKWLELRKTNNVNSSQMTDFLIGTRFSGRKYRKNCKQIQKRKSCFFLEHFEREPVSETLEYLFMIGREGEAMLLELLYRMNMGFMPSPYFKIFIPDQMFHIGVTPDALLNVEGKLIPVEIKTNTGLAKPWRGPKPSYLHQNILQAIACNSDITLFMRLENVEEMRIIAHVIHWDIESYKRDLVNHIERVQEDFSILAEKKLVLCEYNVKSFFTEIFAHSLSDPDLGHFDTEHSKFINSIINKIKEWSD